MTSRSAPRRPRRRGATKGDRTELAILETAERLLAERPLTAIGVDELASGAGISRPTFYFYFDSREAVLYTLAERLVIDLYAAAERWLQRGDDPVDVAVRQAVTETVALWRAHGAVLRATVRARDVDEEMRRFWSDVGRRFVEATAERIERDRAAGLAAPGPPPARALAAVLVAMNEQVCFNTSLTRRSAVKDREVVDTLVAVWLRSVYDA